MDIRFPKTGAFDSLVQITTNAIAIYKWYKNTTSDIKKSVFELAQNLLQKGKIDVNAYKDTARILMDISSRDPYIYFVFRRLEEYTL